MGGDDAAQDRARPNPPPSSRAGGRHDASRRRRPGAGRSGAGGLDPLAFALLPEVERLALILRAGRVPGRCGPAYPVAPARGFYEVVDFEELVPAPTAAPAPPATARGDEPRARSTVRVGDAFTLMEEQARRAARRGTAFVAPFTPGRSRPGGSMPAWCSGWPPGPPASRSRRWPAGWRQGRRRVRGAASTMRRLSAMRRRIGPGVALSIRRAPSARAGGARGG